MKQSEKEIGFLQENNTFNLKIVTVTLDRHGPRLKLNNCHLGYPPNFSLLTTFSVIQQTRFFQQMVYINIYLPANAFPWP
jgi:hypothetical protein